ncbi:MAG: hypothetical protein JW741_06160 [Sedimentisphaerales bacterium]|nr:hypothetical protein [Sedimentisphaerales bacterium]
MHEAHPFLIGIAKEVDTILATCPVAIPVFQNHISTFNEAWRTYWQARCDEPQPYEDSIGRNGRPGYEYDSDLKVWFPIDEASRGPDPLTWEGCDKAPCYYTALAVIYDWMKGPYVPLELCKSRLDPLCFGFMKTMFEQKSFDWRRMETALTWVKADLAQCEYANSKNHGNEHFGFKAGAERIKQAKSQEEAAPSETHDASPYVVVDLAARTLSIGNDEFTPSDKVWAFLKELIDAKRHCLPDPKSGEWKNAYDMLRRKIGKENLPCVVEATSQGYRLAANVKVKGGGQIGIRRSK